MVKILSQEEIDSLINTVAGGDIEEVSFDEQKAQEKTIITYDFKHPNRVNKDQIRTIESLHDNFANHLGSAYSTYTRAMVDVDLVAVDQITYSEYIMSLTAPSSTYIFNMDPLQGAGIINFNTAVAFFIVDRIFGGSGKTFDTERELTGIERSIMNKVFNKTLTGLEKAWEHVTPISMRVNSYETNPQFVQIVPPGETVITVSLQIKMAGSFGIMTICYPYIVLEDIIHKLSAQHWIDSSKKKKLVDRERNIKRIQTIKSDLSVQLLGTSIGMRDLLNVREGDVICLDNGINEKFTVLIEDERKFMGVAGKLGNRRAVKLTTVCPPSEDLEDHGHDISENNSDEE